MERLRKHSVEGAAGERPRGSWVQIYKPSLISKVQTAAQGSRLFMDHESTSLQAHQLEPEDVYHVAERKKKRKNKSGICQSEPNKLLQPGQFRQVM